MRVCRSTREIQDGVPTPRKPLAHLCRFLLLGIYTGSRPGAILRASWLEGPWLAWVDTAGGVFHRHADGAPATAKRQPTVRLAPGLLGHLRCWERLDAAKMPRQAFVVEFGGAPVLSVKTAMARACKLAGLDAGVTAYTLRHTCASWLVARGISTRMIADFLGTSETMILKTTDTLRRTINGRRRWRSGKNMRRLGKAGRGKGFLWGIQWVRTEIKSTMTYKPLKLFGGPGGN